MRILLNCTESPRSNSSKQYKVPKSNEHMECFADRFLDVVLYSDGS